LDAAKRLVNWLNDSNGKEIAPMNVSMVVRMALVCVLSVSLWAAGAAGAFAADSPKLGLKMTTEKEVKAVNAGKEVVERIPAENVKPGDIVVYTVRYTNSGAGEAKDAAIVDPIPKGTVYVVESATGKGTDITCSIDGGKSYHKQPVRQSVTMPDGKTVENDADPAMYTHVKWVVQSVKPGKSGMVSFKTKVE